MRTWPGVDATLKRILHGTYVPFILHEYWTLLIFEHNSKSAYKTPKIKVQDTETCEKRCFLDIYCLAVAKCCIQYPIVIYRQKAYCLTVMVKK